jgi:hypothetical protein
MNKNARTAGTAPLDWKEVWYTNCPVMSAGNVDFVPRLSPHNLAAIEVGKDFMLSHGYIKNDFSVSTWAAPEFLEKAAKELIEEQWKKVTAAKLPEPTALRLG